MPNTQSAKKAVRSSHKKAEHNLVWKKRIKDALKSVKKGLESKDKLEILTEKLTAFQKVLDKSAKEKVIHKNKANRLKSIYAKKITALFSATSSKAKKHAK